MKNKYNENGKRTIKQRIIDMLKNIYGECKDVKTLIIFCIVCIIVYIPVWGGYLFFFLTKNYIFLTVATICLTFWAGPFTPFFPLCITITLLIKTKYYAKKEEVKEKIDDVKNKIYEKRKIASYKKVKRIHKLKNINNKMKFKDKEV